jgi:hypothetical protein
MQQALQPSYRRVQQGRKGGALSVTLSPEFVKLANIQKQDFVSQDVLTVNGSVVLMLNKVENGGGIS